MLLQGRLIPEITSSNSSHPFVKSPLVFVSRNHGDYTARVSLRKILPTLLNSYGMYIHLYSIASFTNSNRFDAPPRSVSFELTELMQMQYCFFFKRFGILKSAALNWVICRYILRLFHCMFFLELRGGFYDNERNKPDWFPANIKFKCPTHPKH